MKNEPHFQVLIYKFAMDFGVSKSNARMKIDAAWIQKVPPQEKNFDFFPYYLMLSILIKE
ncbi:MAG: hypothetical protein ABR936_01210 [Bacteroidota bacterium]|jgi:hypothetical protein